MLDLYKKRLLSNGRYMGEVLKNQSDMIMDKTFTRDIAYRLCYINDQPVDAKYIVHTYYNISKDAVDYHLQFRPGVHYPIGTYVDIPDDVGAYNRWLIVARSDEPQFVKYNVLKCNWTFKWIENDKLHECLGVLRTRNSYNSGLAISPILLETLIYKSFELLENPESFRGYNIMLKYISVNAKNSKDWAISSQILYKGKVQRPVLMHVGRSLPKRRIPKFIN